MKKNKTIHLEKPNTLTNYLTKREREEVVSLKITGVIGQKDFNDVLNEMCDAGGEYDEFDTFIPDFDITPALRHLDMSEATYVDGDCLPYFGSHAQLETFIFPQGVKSTFDGIENDTGLSETDMLKTLVFPAGLKTVGGFHSCPNLIGIVFPEGLDVIGPNAFCGCKAITSIRIPSSVREMYGGSFAGCQISAYEVDENNPYYTSVDGVIYSKDLRKLIAFPSASPRKNYKVLRTTKTIGSDAFMFSHVEHVELPAGVEKIEKGAFEFSNIERIEVPSSLTVVEEFAFYFCDKMKVVTMEGVIPPKITGHLDEEVWRNKNVVLFVPLEAMRTYESAPGWRFFKI